MNKAHTQAERLVNLRKHRAELDKKIRDKERKIRHTTDELFKPSPKPVGRMGFIMSNISTLAAVADGAILGYRLYRKLRRFT